jgi:transposase
MMFGIGAATRIYLAVGATDMRKSFEGLSGLIQEKLRQDPLSGHLFLFCNKPRNRLKVVFWDGHGLWVCAKRLEKGRLSWPLPDQSESSAAAVKIKQEELAMLLGGIDMARTERKRWWRREVEES